jgi:hypothetical protein
LRRFGFGTQPNNLGQGMLQSNSDPYGGNAGNTGNCLSVPISGLSGISALQTVIYIHLSPAQSKQPPWLNVRRSGIKRASAAGLVRATADARLDDRVGHARDTLVIRRRGA